MLFKYGLLTVFGTACVVNGLQVPFKHHDSKERSPHAMFVNHFAASRSGTDVFLQNQLASIYSNSSVVVTQDYYFDLPRFAAQSESSILIREMDDLEALKRVVYVKPSQRRSGHGFVGDRVVFGGWEVAWENHEFKVIVATFTQWHIIGDNNAAHRLIHACAEFCSSYSDVVWVFEQGFWSPDPLLWQSIQEDVILNEKLKTSLQHDYRSFFKSEATYKKFAVPWKRGIMFLGVGLSVRKKLMVQPPGNGKTVSLKAIMKEVVVPVLYVRSFHHWLGDETGIKIIFARARAEAPCVLVLEDLDSLITDLNRSFFLNEVDGLEINDGVLIIGTTNHFDRLDPALSNRPSRFDRKYNFPNPSSAERRDYAVYWQHKLETVKEIDFPDTLLDEFAEKTGNFSFAYMKEAFVSSLLVVATRETDKLKADFRQILFEQIKNLRDELEATDLSSAAPTSKSDAGGAFGGGFFEANVASYLNKDGGIFRYPTSMMV